MSAISRRTVFASSAALPLLTLPLTAAPAPGSYGMVRRQSADLDAIVDVNATVEQIGWGYTWSEGPVWVKDGGYLLFSDPRTNTIYKWTAGAPPAEFMKPSGYAGKPDPTLREPGSNGLTIDAAGALVMADSGSRAIAKVDLKTKAKTFLVDKCDGKRFNSPNDLCIAKSGAIYFTDPPYGLTDGMTSAAKELPFSGVYRFDPNGTLTVLDKELAYPNGIALSPDESTLYVTNTDSAKPMLKAYSLGANGQVESARTLFDFTAMMSPSAKGGPDGIKIDQDGNLFVAGPGGILVLSNKGKLLGLINVTGRASPNCAFGEDGSTLFICATDIVAKVKLNTRANW